MKIRYMKKIINLIVFVFSFTTVVLAQESKSKVETVIKTSAQCGDCKERIEDKLNYTKGILFAELDVDSKNLTVKYKSDKITLDEIKMILNDLGYDADDWKANKVNVESLPKCCQPGGMVE